MKWLHTIWQRFEPRALVLMYHRVANVALDPWDLAVSPANFDAQVQWLVSRYNVIPVTELIKNLQQQKLSDNSVCITFDDGYTDNYLFAKPILEKYNCPATFFIPSHYIGQGQPFWWDRLQAVLLEAPRLPQLFQIPMLEDFKFDVKGDTTLTPEHVKQQETWRWPAPEPTRRCALYVRLWEQLRPLPLAEIETAVAEVQAWAGYEPAFPESLLPMNPQQLADLARHPLFDIGLHTTTHPALAYHAEDVQYWELAENKKALQPYHPINAVAFPYGNYNNSTLSVLQKQRLEAGFTTESKKLTRHTKLQRLGRFQVRDSGAAAFEKDLKHWLNT